MAQALRVQQVICVMISAPLCHRAQPASVWQVGRGSGVIISPSSSSGLFQGSASSSATRVNISRVMLLLKMAVRGKVDADLQVTHLADHCLSLYCVLARFYFRASSVVLAVFDLSLRRTRLTGLARS
jgi:hypothetical protein